MTIEELGSLGEFIGSLLLIVSVLYLAIQVRQNAKAERNTAMQNILSASAESNHLIADNPEFAAIVLKAVHSPDEITELERLRINVRLIALYHHLDGAYHMHQSGLLDDDIWAKFDYEAPLWIKMMPIAEDWYVTDRNRLSPSFRAYLDQRLEELEVPEIVPTVGVKWRDT